MAENWLSEIDFKADYKEFSTAKRRQIITFAQNFIGDLAGQIPGFDATKHCDEIYIHGLFEKRVNDTDTFKIWVRTENVWEGPEIVEVPYGEHYLVRYQKLFMATTKHLMGVING